MLHFKTGCGMIDEETVVITPELDDEDLFGSLRRLVVPREESAVANILRVRDTVLMGEGFPKTREMIEARGIKTRAMPISEIAKIDAGLSCMSLRWRAN